LANGNQKVVSSLFIQRNYYYWSHASSIIAIVDAAKPRKRAVPS